MDWEEEGITTILLAEELAHARLPPPALVERHASVLGAAPGETRALPAEHVDELLLAQVAHLLADRWMKTCVILILGNQNPSFPSSSI